MHSTYTRVLHEWRETKHKKWPETVNCLWKLKSQFTVYLFFLPQKKKMFIYFITCMVMSHKLWALDEKKNKKLKKWGWWLVNCLYILWRVWLWAEDTCLFYLNFKCYFAYPYTDIYSCVLIWTFLWLVLIFPINL